MYNPYNDDYTDATIIMVLLAAAYTTHFVGLFKDAI
tara:strand:- start:63 stop:170 length:108 start_codon:yes stop_codon:yes gene_type:complete